MIMSRSKEFNRKCSARMFIGNLIRRSTTDVSLPRVAPHRESAPDDEDSQDRCSVQFHNDVEVAASTQLVPVTALRRLRVTVDPNRRRCQRRPVPTVSRRLRSQRNSSHSAHLLDGARRSVHSYLRRCRLGDDVLSEPSERASLVRALLAPRLSGGRPVPRSLRASGCIPGAGRGLRTPGQRAAILPPRRRHRVDAVRRLVPRADRPAVVSRRGSRRTCCSPAGGDRRSAARRPPGRGGVRPRRPGARGPLFPVAVCPQPSAVRRLSVRARRVAALRGDVASSDVATRAVRRLLAVDGVGDHVLAAPLYLGRRRRCRRRRRRCSNERLDRRNVNDEEVRKRHPDYRGGP